MLQDLGCCSYAIAAVHRTQKVYKKCKVAWTYQKINSCGIPNSLEDLGRILYRNPPELCLLCATDTSATLSAICTRTIRNFTAFWTRTFRNLTSHLVQNSPEAGLLSANMPSNSPQTLLAICTGTLRTSSAIWNPPEPCLHHTVRNLISHLHRTPPEFHQPSAPEPSGNFISFLRHNPPELHQPSAPEPSGTSSAICTGTRPNLVCYLHRTELSGTSSAFSTGTLRNLISYLPRNSPEPHQPSAPEPWEFHQPSAPEGSGTLRNLFRNLVLQLHRIAPELFWAKDPIASLAVGE